MSGDNVRHFRATGQEPIVGQAVDIVGFAVIVTMRCKCGAVPTTLMINGLVHIVECDACKGKFRIGRLAFDHQTNALNINISRVTAIAAPTPPAG